MRARERLAHDLVRWLRTRLRVDARVLDVDTPLFATRLVDSLMVLELIAFTERALRREIPDAQICLANFHSAARIAEVFVPEESDAIAT